MPTQDPSPADEPRDATLVARRASRFHYAERRIRAIADGAPPLTDDQLDRLARILRPTPDTAAGLADAAGT